MDVILLKPIKRKGKIGDVVVVKDGFARNFLIPHGLAMRATAANMSLIEEKKHDLEAKNDQAVLSARQMHAELNGKEFLFIRNASNDGRLFGSINGREIAAHVKSSGVEISYSAVQLAHPIKAVGVYEVTVELHSEVDCSIFVVVAQSETEGMAALREFKASVAKEDTAVSA